MARSPWEPDGTQSPDPLPAWSDPVIGGAYPSEPLSIEMAQPVQPDLDEVRRAVDAALQGEDEASATGVPAPRRGSAAVFPETPGLVPPNPRAGWPRTPSVRQIPGFRPRPPARIQRVRRPGSSGAVIATTVGVLILVGVIITIIVMIIVSLSETIGNILN